MTNRIDHTDCPHPKTAKGRADCRKAGTWYAFSVNNGHDEDCLAHAAYRAAVNGRDTGSFIGDRLAGLELLDAGLVDCVCGQDNIAG